MRDRGEAANEQREAGLRFSEVLRERLEASRPRLEDLMGQSRTEEPEAERERQER